MNEQFPHLVSLSTQYTILYVEDDSDTQEEVARTLRRLFKEVYLASDGEEGLAKFKQYAPSLVMSDIQMPRKNGLEMVSAIKEIAPDTPVVIATAFNDERFFIKAIECGIDAFLLKPIDKQKLYQTLLKIVERMHYKEQTQELERLRMLTQINQASEESIKNLAQLDALDSRFEQKDVRQKAHPHNAPVCESVKNFCHRGGENAIGVSFFHLNFRTKAPTLGKVFLWQWLGLCPHP